MRSARPAGLLAATSVATAGHSQLSERPHGGISSAVFGGLGDKLAEQQPELAIELVRDGGRDAATEPEALAQALPAATSDRVVVLHRLSPPGGRGRAVPPGPTS